jgi:hypothetical protein
VSGLTSPLFGTAVIDETQEADLLAGQWYINVHTELNQSGEIRGQVLDSSTLINLTSSLDRNQESPAVDPTTPSTANGSASITFDPNSNLLSWNISFDGLSGPAQAAHFHGPAGPGTATGVQVNIGETSGLTSPMIGSAIIDDTQETDLLAGQWYINIHTELNQSGEIRGQVSDEASIVDFISLLDRNQETPAVDPTTPASANGSASVKLDTVTNLLTWNISFDGLSGPAQAAHFHGPAGPGTATGVQVNIGTASGLDSPMIGSAVIDDTQETDLLAGSWYINIHTELNQSGEIRGQVLDTANIVNLTSMLDPGQETPAVDPATPTTAMGSADVVYDPPSNLLMWNINFGGLSGPAQAAHFHGPAAPGVAAGVKVNIGDASGLESPMIGSAVIDEADEPDLLSDLWYINIHTELNQSGEIRGQVIRSVFADGFEGDGS